VVPNVYGLRLLAKPRIRATVAGLLVLLIAVFRVIQLFAMRDQLPWGYDFSAYWLAGRHLIEGQPLYTAAQLAGDYAPQAHFLYLYPPPLAALVVPLALPFPGDYTLPFLIWILAGAAAAGAVMVRIVRADPSGRLRSLAEGRGLGLLVLATLALPPVIDELINGNVHFWLLALLGLGWLGVARGDASGERLAGLAIGIAAIVKIFPGLVILWFLLTGRWRAAAWSIVGAAALSIVTLPITGIQPWLDYPAVLLNMGTPIDPTFSLAPTTWLTPALGFAVSRVVVTGIGLVIVAWASRAADVRVGYAITVVAALLVTPILWTHYLAVIVLPMLLALLAGVPAAIVGVIYVLLSAGNQAAFGETGFFLARALPTLGMVLLLAALVIRRRTAAAG
jgi:alpha-1,2-mannosyltransferase